MSTLSPPADLNAFTEFRFPLSAQDRMLLIRRDWRYFRNGAIPVVVFILIYLSNPLPAVAAVLFGFVTPIIFMVVLIIVTLNHNKLDDNKKYVLTGFITSRRKEERTVETLEGGGKMTSYFIRIGNRLPELRMFNDRFFRQISEGEYVECHFLHEEDILRIVKGEKLA